MKKITFLIPFLFMVLLVPGMVFADKLEDEKKYHDLTKDEKITLNGERGKEIVESLGGYDDYKDFIKSDVESDLKKEIRELNEKMSELGIMTIEELRDPIKRMEFYLDHPEIIEDEHGDIEQVVWTEVSHSCNCGTTVKAKMGYHHPFAWWSYDAYLQPTTWQTLYPNIAYTFDNNNINHEHNWIKPFIKVYTSQSGTQTIEGFASVDDSPPYDEEISKTKFFTRNVVKTFDFPEYSHGIDEDTYVWGTTTWVN